MKIVIVDDHDIVRRGLQQIIDKRPGWSVVGEAADADEVLPLLRRKEVDVLVLDLTLGGRSGLDLLPHLRSEFRDLPVLMLSMHDEELYAVRCLRAGAAGYVQKDSSPDAIMAAIERVAGGRTRVSDRVADQLAREVVRGAGGAPHDRLSTREFEIFRLLARGESVTAIAETLFLSVKTVSTYRTRILDKTGFRSNADIIAYAIRNGLI